jgi:hypothetical protein
MSEKDHLSSQLDTMPYQTSESDTIKTFFPTDPLRQGYSASSVKNLCHQVEESTKEQMLKSTTTMNRTRGLSILEKQP